MSEEVFIMFRDDLSFLFNIYPKDYVTFAEEGKNLMCKAYFNRKLTNSEYFRLLGIYNELLAKIPRS